MKKWESVKHKKKAGVYQQKVSRATLPLTAPCWVPLGNGERCS